MRASLVVSLLVSVVAAPLPTLAENTFEGGATVAIVADDLIAARSTAFRLACTNAIASAMGTSASQATSAGWSKLTENPQPFVSDPKILDEGIREGGNYTVRLAAVVHVDQVQAAVAETREDSAGHAPVENARSSNWVMAGNRPTVAVVVTEKFQTLADGPMTLGPKLEEWLIGEGFVCVNLEQAQLASVRDQAAAVLRGDTAAAKAVAGQLKAAWLLVGSVQVTTSPGVDGSDMKQRTAAVSIRLVEADSAGVIATAQANGSCPEIDEMRGGQEAMRRASGFQFGDGVVSVHWTSTGSQLATRQRPIRYWILSVWPGSLQTDLANWAYPKP